MKFETNITICFNHIVKKILAAAEAAYREVLGPDFEPTVTGGLEGKHGARSYHYQNRALDFRTGHHWERPLISRPQAEQVVATLISILGAGYDVLLEANHIHVEYDPKR